MKKTLSPTYDYDITTMPSVPKSSYLTVSDSTEEKGPVYKHPNLTEDELSSMLSQQISRRADNLYSEQSKSIFNRENANLVEELVTSKALENIKASQKQKAEHFISNFSTSSRSYILVPTLNSVTNPLNPEQSVEIGSIELIKVISALIATRTDKRILSEFFNTISDSIRSCGILLEKDEEDPYSSSSLIRIGKTVNFRDGSAKVEKRTSIQLLLQFLNSWPSTDPAAQLERRKKGYMKLVQDIRNSDPTAFQPANWEEVMKLKNESGVHFCEPKTISLNMGGHVLENVLRNLTAVEWVPSATNIRTTVPECRMPHVKGSKGEIKTYGLIPSSLEEPSWIPSEHLGVIEAFYGVQVFKKVSKFDLLENIAKLHQEYMSYDLSKSEPEPISKEEEDTSHGTIQVYLKLSESEEFKAEITVDEVNSEDTKFGLRKTDSQTLLEHISQTGSFWEDLPFYSILLRLMWPAESSKKMNHSQNLYWHIWESKPGVLRMNMQNTLENFRWAAVNKYGPSDLNMSPMECGKIFSQSVWDDILRLGYSGVDIENYKDYFFRKSKEFYENGNSGVCWDAKSVWNLRLPDLKRFEKISDFKRATTGADTLATWSSAEWKRQIENFKRMRLVS